MTAALLDVNVLIALLDPDHLDHNRAHAWAESDLAHGWATCALTQNGVVRILSQPKYPNAIPVAAAARTLGAMTAHPAHVFWPCTLPLTDASIRIDSLLGPRQITDVYLLALAVSQGGRFITLDTRVNPASVSGATSAHLVVL